MILGLDLSLTATGWATIHPDGTTKYGVLPDLGSGAHIAERLDAWGRNLAYVIEDAYDISHEIDLYVEDLGGNQRGAFELGMVWAAFWFELTVELRRRTTKVNAGTLKMHATGKGGAGKPQVLAEAIRRLGYQGHNHNEADALWLADLGARLHGYNRPALPAAHLKALDKMRPKEAIR